MLYLILRIALFASGVIHLLITQEHIEHSPAHGIFFFGIGVLQIGWALVSLRHRASKHTFSTFWLISVALSGGVVAVWLVTILGFVPFAQTTDAIDINLIASKVLECIAFIATLTIGFLHDRQLKAQTRSSQKIGRAILSGSLLSAVLGIGIVSISKSVEPLFPSLQTVANHDHFHIHEVSANYAQPAVEDEQTKSARATFEAALGRPLPTTFPVPNWLADNPPTPQKVALGRHLFYDPRLSGNGTTACASCHIQKLAFTDGRALSVGSTGAMTARNSPTLANVAYNGTLTWGNPVLRHLERQILVPMFGEFPIEMGVTNNEQIVLDRFRQDPRYQKLFFDAYPGVDEPVNVQSIVQSLSSFLRTMISANSAYDRYLAGDETAMSASARRGMEMFLSESFECHHCHTGFNFSASTAWRGLSMGDVAFFNNGLYNVKGTGRYPTGNTGIYEITGEPDDMGKFRPPTLRNIALTAPYMHDGSVATLEEVIKIYARGGRLIETGEDAGDGYQNPHKNGLVSGFPLSDQEAQDFVEFLRSLTDESFINDPNLSDPFVVAAK